MRIFRIAATLLCINGTSLLAQDLDVASDGVSTLPMYLDESGEGILRYSDPEGRAIPFSAATGMLSPKSSRPFEVWSTLGTWTGPEISLCMQYMTPQRVEQTNAVQIYSPTTERVVARFRFVFDDEQAEEIVSTDGGTESGECHSDFLR